MNTALNNFTLGGKVEITYTYRATTTTSTATVERIVGYRGENASVYLSNGDVPAHLALGALYQINGKWCYRPTLQQPSERVVAVRHID